MQAHAHHHAPAKLTTEELKSILSAINKRQHVTLALSDTHAIAHALILGADLKAGIFLLSESAPDVGHLLTRSEHFWVKIKTKQGYLCLALSLLGLENGLLSAKLSRCHHTTNRRWAPRIHFAPHTGPALRIDRDFNLSLDGLASNISQHGLSADFWSKEVNTEFHQGQILQLQLCFHHYFEITTTVRVLDTHFLRKPSCHTQMRMKFTGLTGDQHLQLASFIEAIQKPSRIA